MKRKIVGTCAAAFVFQHSHALEGNDLFGERVFSLNNVLDSLDEVKNTIDDKLFLYQTPAFQWVPSSVYRYEDFKESLYVMATDGVAGKKFYIGDNDVENGHVYGLVNIAAFLAQSMKETIQYDACDENSWDLVGGKYPLSNACGQLGQSYQDYQCSPEEAHMECPVDPEMTITGVTHAKWYGAPAPMSCGPKTTEQPFTGFWDYNYECKKGWANPPESCDVYEGQKAGRFDTSSPYANTAGRTDVEGCCWWGRGVIQTSGVCNFGKLNYYLGAGAKRDGRKAKYPEVDFCKDPEVICASSQYKELKWIAGEFYWTESVQSYSEGGWDYTTELRKFVEGGMTGTSFIDSVSGIVNRGCHNPPCGTGALDGGVERAQNFRKVLDAFFGGVPPQVGSSSGSSPPGSQTGPASSTGSGALGKWYPDYNGQFLLGKCVNEAPLPNGRPSYDTGVECCQKSYAIQASGVCVSSLPQVSSAPSNPPPGIPTGSGQSPQPLATTRPPVSPTSTAGIIISSDNATHALQRSNFITYNCGSYADIPMDSLIVDILFDYEISVDDTAQPWHILPDLKKQIMDDLAHTLGCQTSFRRNLRRTAEDGVLLGFHSAEGGDVIDDEKGSCSESAEAGKSCVPIIGHLAAFVKRDASVDVVIATKDIILNTIEENMAASNGHSNLTQRIVYISEHGNKLQHHPYNDGIVGDSSESNNTTYIIVFLVLALMFVVMAGLLPKRKPENNQQKEESSATSVVNTRRVSWCEQDLRGKYASDGDTSCDGHNNYHGSSTSSNDKPFTNEVLALHPDKDTQPITPSCQELNGASENKGSVTDHAEGFTGECASDGDNLSDVSSYCDNSSKVSKNTLSTNKELILHSDEGTQAISQSFQELNGMNAHEGNVINIMARRTVVHTSDRDNLSIGHVDSSTMSGSMVPTNEE